MTTRGRVRFGATVVAVLSVLTLSVPPGVSSADATDDYPIPNRILHTSCTAEQILAAVRDVRPVYYERYMIDYNNKTLPSCSRRSGIGSIGSSRWTMASAGSTRRTSRPTSTTSSWFLAWPNWAKVFFNNKRAAARATDVCAQYPPGDQVLGTGEGAGVSSPG